MNSKVERDQAFWQEVYGQRNVWPTLFVFNGVLATLCYFAAPYLVRVGENLLDRTFPFSLQQWSFYFAIAVFISSSVQDVLVRHRRLQGRGGKNRGRWFLTNCAVSVLPMGLIAVVALMPLMVSSHTPVSAATVKHEPGLSKYLRIAEKYWGTTPGGCSSYEVNLVDDLDGGAVGRATQPGPDERLNCTMRVARSLNPELKCAVVVHEYGHWLGLDHSADQESVMYVGGQDDHATPQLCGQAGERVER